MASKLGLMVKREALDERLRAATNKLQSRGVSVGSFPDEGRDRDVKEYERAEHTANLLEACVDRIDELQDESRQLGERHGKESDAETKATDAARAEVNRLTRENKDLRAALQNAKKKEPKQKNDGTANPKGDGASGSDAGAGAEPTPVIAEGEGTGLQPGTGTVEVTRDGGQVVVEPRVGSDQHPGDVVATPETRVDSQA